MSVVQLLLDEIERLRTELVGKSSQYTRGFVDCLRYIEDYITEKAWEEGEEE